ncbi:MAG: cobalt-precorrin-5B (C(1))-methyltransferase [Rhizobiaceae bacterium]
MVIQDHSGNNVGGKPSQPLRKGWTTGACATAATKSALAALFTGEFEDPVTIQLPKGEQPAFVLSTENLGENFASTGIIKDAGDDPDVTHGATIISTVRMSRPGSGVSFKAGEGVGTVTKSGLPIAPGEPAINPVPRKMMTDVVTDLCMSHDRQPDIEITISVPGGEEIARQTWNPRLGIKGGISILGTTGIVHPFSCSAWIHSIQRGIDVSRANGIKHVLGATGSTSEEAACAIYDFPESALLDMGDFAGGLLKYLRNHPIPKLTIAGGFAKMAKLANGSLDLHSGRSQVNMEFLAEVAVDSNLNQDMKKQILDANTALEVLELTQENGVDLASSIAQLARKKALKTLNSAPVEVELIVVSRSGELLARTGFDG